MLTQLLRPLSLNKNAQVLEGVLFSIVFVAVFAKTTTTAKPIRLLRNSKGRTVSLKHWSHENFPAWPT